MSAHQRKGYAVVEQTVVCVSCIVATCFVLCLTGCSIVSESLLSRDLRIQSVDAGVVLGLRERVPQKIQNPTNAGSSQLVLFLHGATLPGTVAFDFEDLPGGSWLTYIAKHDFAGYVLDVRGYGISTRPVEMSRPALENAPVADTADGVQDVNTAVDAILTRRHAQKLTIVAWSWGTTIAASYAALNPQKVDRLVLIAPVWKNLRAPDYAGAYRAVTHDALRAFTLAGLPSQNIDAVSPQARFEALWAAALATDPSGAAQLPPVLRVPNGSNKDLKDSWGAGKPTYDPTQVRAPTLLVVGEWDVITPPETARNLFSALTNAAERQLVILSGGTHCLPIESNRTKLMQLVQSFIEEPR